MAVNEMLSIVTCALQGDEFIPLDELTKLQLDDPLYVDGSIRVTIWGKPLITDAHWTDIVNWWGSMSNVLRSLSNGAQRSDEGSFSWPGSMLFEIDGERLTWTMRGFQTQSATLDRAPALRILMHEYRRFFERMQVLSPRNNGDYDVALDYMKHFKPV